MKRNHNIILFILSLCFTPNLAYTQNNNTSIEQDTLFNDSLVLTTGVFPFSVDNIHTAFVYYYPYYNDIQMIEIETSLYYIWDMEHGPPRDFFYRLAYDPLQNPVIFRNQKGKIIRTYNLHEGQLKNFKLLSPKKSLGHIITHKEVNQLKRNHQQYYKDRGYREFPLNHYVVRSNNELYGVIDTLGNEVLKAELNNVVFRNNSYYVQKSMLWGLYGITLNEIIPCKYDKLKYLRKNYHCACLPLCGVITTKEDTIVPFVYTDILAQPHFYFFQQNQYWQNENGTYAGEYRKYGVMDLNFTVVTPATYVDVQPYPVDVYPSEQPEQNNKKAIVYWAGKRKNQAKNTLYGGLNEHGYEITKFKYSSREPIKTNPKRKLYTVELQNEEIKSRNGRGQYVFLDSVLNQVGDVYDEPIGFDDNGYGYVKKNNKHGLINTRGELLIPCEYDEMQRFQDTVAVAALMRNNHKKWGIINRTGKVLIDFDYDEISTIGHGTVAVCKIINQSKKFGLISLTGQIILPFEYDYIYFYSHTKIFYARQYLEPGKRVDFKFTFEYKNNEYVVTEIK